MAEVLSDFFPKCARLKRVPLGRKSALRMMQATLLPIETRPDRPLYLSLQAIYSALMLASRYGTSTVRLSCRSMAWPSVLHTGGA